MGSARAGKTSLVGQFLYAAYSPRYRPTVEDMHTVELDCQGIHIAGWPIIYIATCWTAAIGCRPINILASAISSTLPTQSILYYVGYYILYNRNLFLIVFLYFSAPSFLIFCLMFDTILSGCMHYRTTQAWISVWTFWTRAAVTFSRPCERWPSNRLMVSSWSALPTILRLSRSRYIRFLYSLASFFDIRPCRINRRFS